MRHDSPDREERRKRRETYAADRIRSTMIGAGKQPVRWWGPFDAGDAVARTSILFGVWIIGIIAIVAANPERSPTRRGLDVLEIIAMLFATVFLLLPVFAGFGILMRKFWGVILLRLTMGFMALPALIFLIGVIADTYYFVLQGTGLLCIPFLLSFYHVWKYWNARHVRYQFTYLRKKEVGLKLFDTTKGAAIPFSLMLIGLPVAAPIWYSLATERGRNYDSMVALVVMVAVVCGFMFGCAGYAFRKRYNAGRLWMLALTVIVLAAHVLCSIMATASFIDATMRLPAAYRTSLVMEISVGIFGLLIPVYILLEVLRFLLTDKAKAWCRMTRYVPPWALQLKILNEREKESLLPENPDAER